MMVNPELLDIKVKEVNLNYTSLAILTGCNRSTFYNIRRGRTSPSYEVINATANVLKLSPTEIFNIFFSKKIPLPVQPINDNKRFCSAIEVEPLN